MSDDPKQIMLMTKDMDIIVSHINNIINKYPDKKIYIFLDIDDVVVFDRTFNEEIYKLLDLTGNIMFLTARNPNKYRFFTIKELNSYMIVNEGRIIFSPPCQYTGKSTKGNTMLNFLESNDVISKNIHIVFIDDLFCNIISVLNALQNIESDKLSYMLYQYK